MAWTPFTRRHYDRSGRCTIAQSSGFASQNRHIMPRIVGCLASAKATLMVSDIDPVLPDNDPVGISMNLDRPADGSREN